MSLLGFDFGTESCITAIVKERKIDFVLNDESKPETPAIVCFGDKQRFIGTAGAASSTTTTDLNNSISHIKRLIGKKFSDLELQRDLKSLPFIVTKGPDGYPLIHVQYLGKSIELTATQLFGTMLSHLKDIALKNMNAAAVDCCIGIPVYFTDLQRRLVLDAATIAGLHPLRLIHETTATALNYGIYHAVLPKNNKWLNVAFVDIGHASMQVCIARFRKWKLEVMSHSYDSSLGGRDFDEALFDYFAAKFDEEYKIDVHQNAGACMKLRAACEKLKKVLSTNSEAPLHIKNLMNGKDLKGSIKRDHFEQLSVSILQRVKGLLVKAIAEAGRKNIDKVEVVGYGSRVPSINKILKEVFKMEPGRTMSASQCVARGAALQCAILSPTIKTVEYQVNFVCCTFNQYVLQRTVHAFYYKLFIFCGEFPMHSI